MTQFFRRLKRNPLQTLLTVLQVLLGTFAMTFALSAYLTPDDTSSEDTFHLIAGYQAPDGTGQTYNVFLPSDLPELLNLASEVEDISISSEVLYIEAVYKGERYKFARGANVTPNYFETVGIQIIKGSAFTKTEQEREEAVVVLSEVTAKIIFAEADPIGQELLISGTTYRVLGLFSDVTGQTLYGQPGIYFPTWAYVDSMSSGQGFMSLMVKAKPGQGSVAGEQLLAAVRQVYKDNFMVKDEGVGRDFYISSSEHSFGSQPTINPIFIILGLFGIVALIISSIGMFSNTFVDITRRTHEIGINRALGATSNAIGRLFSLESALLALIGSVLGAILAALLMPVLIKPLEQSFLYGTQRVAWQPEAALIVILIAVALGALLAFIPALRAGRMKPIEALRNI
jgi:ABC-type antimicrobial peptide transport system permease subunit